MRNEVKRSERRPEKEQNCKVHMEENWKFQRDVSRLQVTTMVVYSYFFEIAHCYM